MPANTPSAPALNSSAVFTPIPVWFWTALLVLHAFYFGYQLRYSRYVFPDTDRYLTEAMNIWTDGEFYARPLTDPRKAQEYTIRPPGYPMFLLLLGAASNQLFWVLLAQNALSILNIGVVARLANRIRPSESTWVVLFLLVVAYPAQCIYANVLMSEMVLQTTVVAMLWCAIRYLTTKQSRYLTGSALALTAAMLIKPVFFPLAMALPVIGVAGAVRWRRPAVAGWALLPFAVAMLYQTWNYQRTGYFHFSSIAEINLLRYNALGVLRKIEGVEAAERFVDVTLAAAERYPSFAQQQRFITVQSSNALIQHPVAYGLLHIQGMVNFFLDPGRFDLVYFFHFPDRIGGGLLAQFTSQGYSAIWAYLRKLPIGLLAVLAVIGLGNLLKIVALLRFSASHSVSRGLQVVVIALILYVALLTGPLGAARFAVPVFPLFLLPVTVELARFRS